MYEPIIDEFPIRDSEFYDGGAYGLAQSLPPLFKEVDSPNYERIELSDGEELEDGSVKIEWVPSKQGEIWVIVGLTKYHHITDDEPFKMQGFTEPIPAYGSLRPSISFIIHPPQN